MVAPKGSGTSLRSLFLEGRGINSSFAIEQDYSGKAFERTIALGIGIGSGYLFLSNMNNFILRMISPSISLFFGNMDNFILGMLIESNLSNECI